MQFDISKSLYPDGKIRFLARDPLGHIRIRVDTLEEMEKAIEEFNKPKEETKPEAVTNGDEKPKKKKFLFNRLGELIRAKPAP